MALLVTRRGGERDKAVACGGDLELQGGVVDAIVLASEVEEGGSVGRYPGDVDCVEGVEGDLLGNRWGWIEPCYVGVGRLLNCEGEGEEGKEDGNGAVDHVGVCSVKNPEWNKEEWLYPSQPRRHSAAKRL